MNRNTNMKVSQVKLIFKDLALRKATANIRLANPEDTEIATVEDRDAYLGPIFIEGETCEDLHCVIRDGTVNVNFIEGGERISYVYPQSDLGRTRLVQPA